MYKRAPMSFPQCFARLLLVPVLIASAALSAFFAVPAHAAIVSNVIGYQGRLLNANGVPVADADAEMIFEIYDDAGGGGCVWSNSSSNCSTANSMTIPLTDGLFSENLGSTGDGYSAILDATFTGNSTLFLQVTINGEALSPRKAIVASMFALSANTLDGLSATTAGSTTSAVAAYNANGNLVITGDPVGSGVSEGSLYVNPDDANIDSGETIFGVAVSDTEMFTVREDGSASIAGMLSVGGGIDVYGGGILTLGQTNTTGINLCLTPGCDMIEIGTGGDADGINIGDGTDSLALTSSSWSFSSTGLLTFTALTPQTTAITLTDTDYTNALSIGDNNITGTTANIDLTNFDVVGSSGNITTQGDVMINGGNLNFGATTTIGDGTQFLILDSDGGLNISDTTILLAGAGDKSIISQAGTGLSLQAGTGISLTNNTAGNNMILTTLGSSDLFQFFTGNIKLGNASPNVTLNGDDTFISGTFEVATDAYVDGNLKVGNGTPGMTLNGEDAYVEGTFEVDGQAHFDEMMTITKNIIGDATTTPNSQALVIDINETQNNDESILIRSDAAGTPDAEFRFENDGDAFADGAWNGGGADFAEYFLSSDASLTAGKPVCTDPEHAESVRGCVVGDSRIVGVISSNPAFIGNGGSAEENRSTNPNYRLVGLTGQIDTLVSAADGAIAIGDPIAISTVAAGYGGKANGPSRIIGFALEPLAAGQATIKVLVQPQWHGSGMLADDGSALMTDGDIQLSALANVSSSSSISNSHALLLSGSAWNGSSADEATMGLRTRVDSLANYRLAFENTLGGEVASITNTGDILVSGKLYPSDRGLTQTDAYIFYDSSAGGGYMKTNAAGWNVGSYDFAEMFPSTDSLAAGDVVIFGDARETVKKSGTTSYDSALVGVVSTRPGFLAGEYKAGSYPVALSGRVPTSVSTENGAIHIGDPLTTSSTPGVAMKATHAGPILGYAMEDLAEGSGKIIAFIRASYYSGTGTNAAPDTNTVVSGNSLSNLDISGILNMNGGNILSVGALEGAGGAWKILANGNFETNGAFVKNVRSYTGDLVPTYPTTTTTRTVELSGTSTLQNGWAVVTFADVDSHFNQIISSSAAYRVLVTPAGVTGQIYVTDRSNGGFIIHDTAGSSGILVDWLVIAYEKDHEPAPVVAGETVEEPVVENPPAVEEPTTDPVVDEPVSEEPVIEEPVVDPVIEETLVDEPVPEVTIDEAPVQEGEGINPASEEPVAVDPVDVPLP